MKPHLFHLKYHNPLKIFAATKPRDFKKLIFMKPQLILIEILCNKSNFSLKFKNGLVDYGKVDLWNCDFEFICSHSTTSRTQLMNHHRIIKLDHNFRYQMQNLKTLGNKNSCQTISWWLLRVLLVLLKHA